MGAYDQALVKSLETGNSRDLGYVGIYGDLEKAHIKAHFRLNPKTNRREFIKDYDDTRHKGQVHVSFHKGHKVKVNNPRSKHHNKVMEVTGYSEKYDVVRGKIEGEKHAVDFHADHIEHHDSKGSAKPDTSSTKIPDVDFSKMSDDQLYKYNKTLLKLAKDIHQNGTDEMKRDISDVVAKLAAEVKSRKDKQGAVKGSSFKPGDRVAVNYPGVGWSDEGKKGMTAVTYTIKQVNDTNIVMTDGTVVLKKDVRSAKADTAGDGKAGEVADKKSAPADKKPAVSAVDPADLKRGAEAVASKVWLAFNDLKKDGTIEKTPLWRQRIPAGFQGRLQYV